MPVMFGGIRENAKAKDIAAATKKAEFVLKDNFKPGNPYYLFLLDKKPTKEDLQLLEIEIKNAGFTSYTILNSVDCDYKKEDLKGEGLTAFMKMHRSPWRDYIDFKDRPHAEAIMAFGSAIYSVNGSADVLPDDYFASYWFKPYYYMGHEIYNYDTYIYPVHEVEDIYPKKLTSMRFGNINYKTRFFLSQLKNMVSSNNRTWTPDTREVKYHIIDSKEAADELFKQNMGADLVAFDTETNGFLFYENKLHNLTITWNGEDGYFILWKYIDPTLLGNNLMSCKHRTGANVKFDLKFLWHHGVSKYVNCTDDVGRLSHILNSEIKSGLKPLSYRYTPFGGYDIKLDNYKKETKCKDYSTIPTEILSKYATMDAIVTWRVQQELWRLMDEIDREHPNEKDPNWTIRRWYETQTMNIYKEIAHVEDRGIYVNWNLMNKYREEMREDIAKKKEELKKIYSGELLNRYNSLVKREPSLNKDDYVLPNDFNFGSTTEVGKLFEKLGWPCYGRNDAGVYLTNDESMGAWAREGRPGVSILAELRTESTSLGSFVGDWTDGKPSGWLQYIYHDENDGDPEEGGTYKVQQSYMVMGTKSYRFIGKDPNFQNIPTRNKYAGFVKKCIDTPPADLYIIIGDSGKEYHLAEFEYVKTNNRGWVKASELLETDEFTETQVENDFIRRCGIDKQDDGNFKMPDPAIWWQ